MSLNKGLQRPRRAGAEKPVPRAAPANTIKVHLRHASTFDVGRKAGQPSFSPKDAMKILRQLEVENAELRRQAVHLALEIQELNENRARQH